MFPFFIDPVGVERRSAHKHERRFFVEKTMWQCVCGWVCIGSMFLTFDPYGVVCFFVVLTPGCASLHPGLLTFGPYGAVGARDEDRPPATTLKGLLARAMKTVRLQPLQGCGRWVTLTQGGVRFAH